MTAIGWNIEYGTNTDTSFILIGTSNGSIHETSISANGTVAYFKLLTESVSANKAISPVSEIALSMVTTTTKLDKFVITFLSCKVVTSTSDGLHLYVFLDNFMSSQL